MCPRISNGNKIGISDCLHHRLNIRAPLGFTKKFVVASDDFIAQSCDKDQPSLLTLWLVNAGSQFNYKFLPVVITLFDIGFF